MAARGSSATCISGKHDERTVSPPRLQNVFGSKLLPWLRAPVLHFASLHTPRELFQRTMVDKEPKPVTSQKPVAVAQVKPIGDLKTEEVPITSGGSVQPEPSPPQDAWRCFVTTSKGSKLLMFVQPSSDVKHIMSESLSTGLCCVSVEMLIL